MDYPLTEKEQETLDKAIELLLPYTKTVSASTWSAYFEEQDEDGDNTGNHDFSGYDTCENEECVNKNHAILKAEYPDINIQFRWYQNDGDHERYEICTVCGRHLNEFLTWIENELDYHIESSITKENIIDPTTAFEISGCLYSMHWNADERMGEYAKAYHYNEGVSAQKAFIKKAVDYAQLVINELS